MDTPAKLIGIDIGGTKISVCLGTSEGEIIATTRFATTDITDPHKALTRIYETSETLAGEHGMTLEDFHAVGLGAPGLLSVREGLILSAPNMKTWTDVHIVRELTHHFGMPVYFNNDANACAIAEYLFGEYRGNSNLIYLTASTGMGGGIIANGKILQGAADIAGEIGHTNLNPDGPPCPCGLNGCFEVYCGGKNVADRTRRRIVGENLQTAILDEAGGHPEQIDFKAIVAAARSGDPLAVEIWDEFTERLAQGVGNVMMAFNPDVILFGTFAIHQGDFFFDPLKAKLPKYAWQEAIDSCILAPSSLGTKIGDLGALAIAASHLHD